MSSTFAATRTRARTAIRSRTAQRQAPPTPRAVAWAETAGLVVVVVLLILGVIATSGRFPASVTSARIVVEKGQTLWTIAGQHPVAGLTTEQTAQLIGELNGIRSGRLSAGRSIRVPARQPDDTGVSVAMR